jgi:hypothetical protein
MIFDHDGVFEIQLWALITGSTTRVVSLPHDPVHAGTGLRHPARRGRPTGERCLLRGYGWDESLIDGLRCYGGMYLYRLGGGWLHDRSNLVLICYNNILYIRNSNKLETKSMIDLIWYLSVTTISYILGTLTNSKLNLLYDRSNLILICYYPILSIRNSNKLKTKSLAQVRSLASGYNNYGG